MLPLNQFRCAPQLSVARSTLPYSVTRLPHTAR
jgi:hypothetical protein